MNSWKHFRRLSYHNVELVSLLVYLSRFESVNLGLVFRDELIANWTKVMVIGVIDKAHVWIV